jgi:pSer/pThr/pTyr-binding forkhead associated (FHA) protein
MLIDCWARAFRLRRRTLVGRDAGVVDIAILDDVVSQRHAELILGPYGWHIVDWHSTNGTFVDGKRITGVHMLSDGQVITFGDVGFVFVEDARRSGR